MKRWMLCCLLLLSLTAASARVAEWWHVDTKTNASFRGLSVVDDSVAWVSGSKGWVGKTVNGGKDWAWQQVKGYEQCDFRSLYAFNDKEAVIAHAGSPAYILRTDDGGVSWKKVYENDDTAAFIDGVDFATQEKGMVYGDPINGRMLLLNTVDGGRTWTELPINQRPLMSTGEASFAASGTCIKYLNKKRLLIATGGTVSRLLISKNNGGKWTSVSTPILQGESSRGIFSFLAISRRRWFIAGGDYKRDTLSEANCLYTHNRGRTWHAPVATTRGYRECVIAAPDAIKPMADGTLLAVGPSGQDISYDNGINWSTFSNQEQFHVIKKARHGKLIIMAGGQGKVMILRHVRLY